MMAKKNLKTSIETIRRRDLVEAAYQTFLAHGLSSMTIAGIVTLTCRRLACAILWHDPNYS